MAFSGNGYFLLFGCYGLFFSFVATLEKINLKGQTMKSEKKEKKLQKLHKKVMAKPLEIVSLKNSQTDPQGSYTGIPLNPYDTPVQDADDL